VDTVLLDFWQTNPLFNLDEYLKFVDTKKLEIESLIFNRLSHLEQESDQHLRRLNAESENTRTSDQY
jgi:hypothetical protein